MHPRPSSQGLQDTPLIRGTKCIQNPFAQAAYFTQKPLYNDD